MRTNSEQAASDSADSRPAERLRTRITTVFALVAITPLVLGALISLVISVWMAQEAVIADQQGTAISIGALLDERWRTTIADLRWTAVALGQADANTSAYPAVIKLLQHTCPACQTVWVIDLNGRVVQRYGSFRAAPPLNTAALAALARGEEILPTDPAPGSGLPSLLLGVPIRSRGTIQNAVLAQLDLPQFGRPVITATHQESQGYSYVIDSNGYLIISPHTDQATPGRDVRAIPLVAAALAGQRRSPTNYNYTGLLSAGVDGVWYRMPGTGWYVLVEAPLAITHADNWYLFLVQILLVLLTAMLALLLGRYLAATITLPIEQVQRGVAHLQAGNLDRSVTVRRDDEIGQLATAFNDMAQELQRRQRTLEAQHDQLADANTELLRAFQASQAANTLKSQFVSTVSHELRTPLTAILGFTDMLRLGICGPLSDDQQQMIECVFESSVHLLHLINDLLDFSKIEGDTTTLHEDDIVLITLVAEVCQTCEPQTRAKPVTIRSHIDPALPTTLRGDALRLRQILLNLVSNAVKFTEQGEVTIDIRRVESPEANEHDTRIASLNGDPALADTLALVLSQMSSLHTVVQIDVEDTGIGIAPEHQRIIFEPFRQIDTSNTRHRAGTGLGLAITQRLVALMGGAIGVTSDLESGSRFTVWLPLGLAADITAKASLTHKERNIPSVEHI